MPKKFIVLFLASLFLMLVSFSAYAAYSSQCATGQTGTEAQTGCTYNNETAILTDQCAKYYAPQYCTSMQAYLNKMTSECTQGDLSSGVDCDTIAQSGIYGREAAKYASYVESNLPSYNGSDTGTSTETNAGTNAAGGTTSSGKLNMPTGFGLPDPAEGIKGILTNLVNWLLGIIGIIALIAFAISGIQYFMAAGNDKITEKAKRNMTYSIIGIIVALSGFVIIRAVDYALNATNSLF